MATSDNQNLGQDGLPLRANPEEEDFRGKYEAGSIGQWLLASYFQAVEQLVVQASISKAARAIEIGCGEGLSTQRLRDFLPQNIDLEASEYVRHQMIAARNNNPRLKIIQESIYELTHDDATFDLVFLLEVLEHLDYPDKGLEEVVRIIKPGGYLVAGVPREPLWRVLNMIRGKYLRYLGNTPGHLNHWSKHTFSRFVSDQLDDIIAMPTPLPWVLVLARKRDIDVGPMIWPFSVRRG